MLSGLGGGHFLKLKLVRVVHEKYSQLTINQSKKKNGKFYLRQPEDCKPGDSLSEGSKDSCKGKGRSPYIGDFGSWFSSTHLGRRLLLFSKNRHLS